MGTNKELEFGKEVYAIVGAAMEVHNQLNAGFAEAVYQEAFAIEMQQRGIPFVSQSRLKVMYKGHVLSCEYIADFVCYQSVIVEIKAVREMTSREEAQIINYLRATGMKVGVLINFGDPARLDWHR
ncbi:MAG: GxxExxY protein, partial [Tepidisphaeraceae bacterium]